LFQNTFKSQGKAIDQNALNLPKPRKTKHLLRRIYNNRKCSIIFAY